MVQDIDIKSKRILLFDFDGTLIETASGYECVEDGVDCCEVSKRFGGGGHAGAAGFVIDVSSDQFKDFLENHKLTSIQ